MYFLNMNFSYKQEGLIFYHNSYSINIIMIIILTPIILYIYKKEVIEFKASAPNSITSFLFLYHLALIQKNIFH
mgnify:CR=1 FL=1